MSVGVRSILMPSIHASAAGGTDERFRRPMGVVPGGAPKGPVATCVGVASGVGVGVGGGVGVAVGVGVGAGLRSEEIQSPPPTSATSAAAAPMPNTIALLRRGGAGS